MQLYMMVSHSGSGEAPSKFLRPQRPSLRGYGTRGNPALEEVGTTVTVIVSSSRHVWDKTLVSSWKIASIDPQTEVFQYVTHSTPPNCDRDHCLLRGWHRDIPTGSYVVASTSVSHPLAGLQAGLRAVHLASHFLLQPCTHGTHVTVICREDWK